MRTSYGASIFGMLTPSGIMDEVDVKVACRRASRKALKVLIPMESLRAWLSRLVLEIGAKWSEVEKLHIRGVCLLTRGAM